MHFRGIQGCTKHAGIDVIILLLTRRSDRPDLTVLDSYGIVTLAWIISCLIGALPFLIWNPDIGFANAVFESSSGFTTTGSTIFADVESLPRSILFWRAISHWLGGMGMVVLAVGLFHSMGIGALFLMRAEAPGPEVERTSTRISATARILWVTYTGLTAGQVILYLFGGMGLFDAVTHAFATLATGGFSTRNASIAAFPSSYIQWVTIAFMILAGVNFVLFVHLARGNFNRVRLDSELKTYFGMFLSAIVVVSISLFRAFPDSPPGDLIRDAAFQVATLFTSPGFATQDYVLWPGAARGVLLICLFLGASAGSTSGGIKVIHVVLSAKAIHREVMKARHPHGVFGIYVNGAVVHDSVVASAMAFVLLYIATVLVSTVVVAGSGASIETALTATLAAIGNVGPGFSGVGPTENFGFFPASTKIWLSAVMILGRLELVTVVAFVPILDRHRAFTRARTVRWNNTRL